MGKILSRPTNVFLVGLAHHPNLASPRKLPLSRSRLPHPPTSPPRRPTLIKP